jgi:uncharacterized protein
MITRVAAAAAAVSLSALFSVVGIAAIPISSATVAAEMFDGIGTTATAALPADFRVDRVTTVRTVGSFTAAATATSLLGGANLSSSASNGIYNFGSGTTTTGPDRAVGFLSSGTATQSGNLYAQLTNASGQNLGGLQIAYDVEKYRAGTNGAGFRIQLFYSANGVNWTDAGAEFTTMFGADAATAGFATAPGTTVAVDKLLAVPVPAASTIYLAWNYSVASGAATTNAQALAIDNISIQGVTTPQPTPPSGVGQATPATVAPGQDVLLTVAVAAGTNPPSTGVSVVADAPAAGLSNQQMFDDGSHGDVRSGDGVFSYLFTTAPATPTGTYIVTFAIADAEARTASGAFTFDLQVSGPQDIVISQVYGGGGNTGAAFRNDFIELYNRGLAPVSVNGWSIQYQSAGGSTPWQVTPLTGTIPAGRYYLVQEAVGAAGSVNLPVPDAIGTVPMAAASGRVALVSTTTQLATATCPATTFASVDMVGYGTATCFEGAAAPTLSNTTAGLRRNNGCSDTNDNAADFITGTPLPRNTAVAGTCTPVVVLDLPIDQIQGTGLFSPYAGDIVRTTGIVTARKSNGFFLQTPDSQVDGDSTTSEGVFVFTSSTPPATTVVGNFVTVTARVQEFIPSADAGSPPVTELTSPTVTLISSGNTLPMPIVITAADASPTSGIANLEKYEGMRVSVPSLTVIAPTGGTVSEANATSTTTGIFYGVVGGFARPMREPGIQVPEGDAAPPAIPRYDANPERIRVDSDALAGAAAINVTTGAVVTGLVGPLDYAFRSYTVLPEPATPPTVTGGMAAIAVPPAQARELTVGSFNMERFFDTVNDDGISDVALTQAAFDTRLNKASLAIRDVLRLPDLIGVEEMENLTTLQAVAARVNGDEMAAGHPNPQYEAILLEGNDIGGIDVGVLYKSVRVAVDSGSLVQIGKDATFVQPDGTVALLNDRPSLLVRASVHVPGAAEFPLTLIVNHLRSLSGVDDPLDGDRVRHKRRAQAEYLANYVQTLQAANAVERIVLVGDFNAFTFNDGYVDVMGTIKGVPTPAEQVTIASADLVNPDLVDLVETAPADQQYSFVFDGVAQELDHVLITQNLLPFAPRLEYARNNADFPEVYRSDATRPERISDHDPIVAYFTAPALTTVAYTGATSVEAGWAATVSALLLDQATRAPLAGERVSFSTGAQSASAITDAAGSASATLALPLGLHLVTVTFAGDASRLLAGATTTATVAVVDTTPPAIASVTPSASALWPPNKAMIAVGIAVAAIDSVDSAVACRVTSIGSNEGTAADRTITGPLSVALRANRNGSGTGRIYTIAVGCRDASGNTSTALTQVVVPHDQR